MQLSDSLEVAIGLSFVFLLLSLIMTALQEAVESFLKVRGARLFDGFVEMLQDPDHPDHDKAAVAKSGGFQAWFVKSWKGFWGYPAHAPAPVRNAVKALYEHPLIHSLYRGDFETANKKNQLPSYIPARSFALALIDQVLDAKLDAADTEASLPTSATQAERLRLAAERIKSEPLRRAVIQAVDMAAGDMEAVQKNLETWFDTGMDRVSGWYRRRTHTFLFFAGLIMAVVLNINTLMIADSLAQNATLRRAVATSVEADLKAYDPATFQKPPPAPAAAPAAATAAAATPATPKTPEQLAAEAAAQKKADDEAMAAAQAAADRARDMSSKAIGRIQDLGLPIGWGAAGRNAYDQAFNALDEHIMKVAAKSTKDHPGQPATTPKFTAAHLGLYVTIGIGWLMTALAITLGAPFWFDLLNRLVVIRATVKPHEKSREERSQDPQEKSKAATLNVQVSGQHPTPTAPAGPQVEDHDAVVDGVHLNPADPEDRPREGDDHETHLKSAA